MKSEDRIETIIKLGLTFDQARTYLALLQSGPATIKEISEISKIARPDVYRIISTLQKEGIIEKLITKPASYQAIPFTHALPTMLKRKQKEQNELEKRTEELLYDLKKIPSKKIQKSEDEFTIVPKKDAIILRLKDELANAQSSVLVITTQKRLSSAILEFEHDYKEALQKGVKIRMATNRHTPKKNALRILQELSNYPNFQIRYFEEPTKAIVNIYDNRKACVILSATAHLSGASAIWSNNPCFVELAQNYFENKWEKNSPTSQYSENRVEAQFLETEKASTATPAA